MTDWDPNHRLLKSTAAPHETAAVLRMQRAGWKGADMLKLFKVRSQNLVRQMQRALNAETEAGHAGRPIHDARVPQGTK